MSPASKSPGRLLSAAVSLALVMGLAHAAPGDLDLTFGAGTGMVGDSMGADGAYGRALVIDASGRIVVAGTALDASADGRFGLLRLNADGSRDAGFGIDGRAIHGATASSQEEGLGLVLQADGKLVMVGLSFEIGPDSDFAALRINDDGTADNSFGNHGNGWMTTGRPGSDVGTAIAVDAGGGFLLGGFVSSSTLLDAAGMRLEPLGAADATYGSGGIVVAASDSNSFHAVLMQPDGKALFGGHIDSNGGAIVQRLNADGSVDASFAGDSRAELSGVLDVVGGIHLLADGQILVAGQRLADARIVRLHANGTIDASFGVAGSLTVTAASLGLSNLVLEALTLDGDGRMLATGYAIGASTGAQLLVLRGLPTGQLDVGFGSGGTRLIDAEGDLFGNALAVQADGAIVIAGTDQATTPEVPDHMLVVRLEGSGAGGTPRELSIDDASLIEGDGGSAMMSFNVSLSTPSTGASSVDVSTGPGSATPNVDYVATTTTLFFANGVSSATFQVAVNGDADVEMDETFLVHLSNPVDANLADADATGTILDNDLIAPTASALPVPGPGLFALTTLALLLLGVVRAIVRGPPRG